MTEPAAPALTADTALLRQAKKRVEMKMGFLTHLSVYLFVNVVLQGIGPWHARHDGLFPFWGWTLGLVIHGLVTLLSLQGGDLRERMLQAELTRLRQRRG